MTRTDTECIQRGSLTVHPYYHVYLIRTADPPFPAPSETPARNLEMHHPWLRGNFPTALCPGGDDW